MMTPTEEELEICRLLPEHEWEVGDWTYNINNKTVYMVGAVRDGYVALINEECFDKKRVINWGWAHTKKIRYSYSMEDIEIWIPHPHQIIALKEWPAGGVLSIDVNGDWMVILIYDKDRPIISQAPTAQLACLRALKPFLEVNNDN